MITIGLVKGNSSTITKVLVEKAHQNDITIGFLRGGTPTHKITIGFVKGKSSEITKVLVKKTHQNDIKLQ